MRGEHVFAVLTLKHVNIAAFTIWIGRLVNDWTKNIFNSSEESRKTLVARRGIVVGKYVLVYLALVYYPFDHFLQIQKCSPNVGIQHYILYLLWKRAQSIIS